MRVSNYPEFSEDRVPLGQRILILEGILRDSLVEKIRYLAPAALGERKGKIDTELYETLEEALNRYLALPTSDKQIHFAASFAYADFSAGKTFDVVFPRSEVKSGVECKSILKAFISEWQPLVMEGTSAGHRFICVLEFPDGVPYLIASMKEVDGFMQVLLKDEICLCSHETWRHLKVIGNI
ncbi:MAG: hypothetical protein LC754_15710 [Acidobacteria bacterium]|nr:hypothetical protein [Acidobacteriota bacterium]